MICSMRNLAISFLSANFRPDGFDALRDSFIGVYHDESNPVGVIRGELSGSYEKTGNHCAALQKHITLAPGEEVRLIFMLGQGRAEAARAARERYANRRRQIAVLPIWRPTGTISCPGCRWIPPMPG